MFKTLRMKLLIGLAPLLAIMVGLGLWAVSMFFQLGGKIDMILRENYTSVLASEGMKEAIERLDSALLFAIGGEEAQSIDQFAAFRPVFEKNLSIELKNITLPGEQEMADKLKSLFESYLSAADRFFGLKTSEGETRRKLYFAQILPIFNAIKGQADEVLSLNQRNMEDESRNAREAAHASIRWMILGLIGSSAVAAVVSLVLSRSILQPIRDVTRGARALARGDLDQVVASTSRDELGELARAFNVMARTIREFQQAGTARLLRAQKTAQATIDSFPDPVVVIDTTGAVERANPAARRILGVVPTDGGSIPWSPPGMLKPLIGEVLAGNPDHSPTSLEHALCVRDAGQERFFLPRVLAIRDDDALQGAAIVLSDVTRFRLMDQLKNDMVSTVSHELKTPLTGLQMAVHLLLEEVVGPLNSKQVELLLAARQDSDRLLNMVNDLLDLTRIEQGRVTLDLGAVAPDDLAREAIAPLVSRATDLGIDLKIEIPSTLPAVLIDRERVSHVFDNLVGNALSHTDRGGSVTVSAERKSDDADSIWFHVADTGGGIAREHLAKIFDRFYRVPGTHQSGGAGLGLAIAREIVIAHQGRIEVSSELGAGAVFSFSLPLAGS